MKVSIPYARKHTIFEIPAEMDYEILRSSAVPVPEGVSQDDLVRKAMALPISSPRLSELACGKKTATIICSDHTRPVPSKHILPHMLAELRQGNPDIQITLLIATGCHRHTTKEELIGKMGEAIVNNEHILVHDCLDENSLTDVGILPSGAKLRINRAAVDTDLLVAEGFIEPHFFAGFSGGRKSILPGVCSRTTVLGNHCAKFIASPCARTGVLEGNPLHRDMLAAARLAKLKYIVNVLIDEKKQAVAAFAGDPFEAHAKGCAYLASYATVKPTRLADIVITSNGGYPMDQNIYQSVKGLTAAEGAAAEKAVIITSASCLDGNGGDSFYQTLAECKSPAALLESILKVPQDQTIPDQWESQILARILAAHHVIFVADPSVKEQIQDMKMDYAATLEEAFQTAIKEKGKDAKLTVIPDGISVIVRA
jgi:nickel-dependent lactate racemase